MKKSDMQKVIATWLRYYIKEMQECEDSLILSSEYMNKSLAVINILWECGVATDELSECLIDAKHGLLKETATFTIYGEEITIKGRE